MYHTHHEIRSKCCLSVVKKSWQTNFSNFSQPRGGTIHVSIGNIGRLCGFVMKTPKGIQSFKSQVCMNRFFCQKG